MQIPDIVLRPFTRSRHNDFITKQIYSQFLSRFEADLFADILRNDNLIFTADKCLLHIVLHFVQLHLPSLDPIPKYNLNEVLAIVNSTHLVHNLSSQFLC